MTPPFLSLSDLEQRALARLPRSIGGFVKGGSEDELSLARNRSSFDRLEFLPRGLRGVPRRDQSVELFGQVYAAPLGIAPMGNCGVCSFEADLALATAATQARIPFVLSGLSNVPLERVQAQAQGSWYQGYLPGDVARIGPLLDRIGAAGFNVLVITIDTAVGANRENNARVGYSLPLRIGPRLVLDGLLHPRWLFEVLVKTLCKSGIPAFPNFAHDASFRLTDVPPRELREGRELLTWEHLRWIRARWRGKLVVKGVLHAEDARIAADHGVDAIIVSNHGGRQLDGAIAPIAALPTVVSAVPADMPVLIDGGFRRGTHVLKAIAQGARMVLLGRPMLYGATLFGAAGVRHVIDLLRSEIDRDMALLGCDELSQVTSGLLRPAA